MRYETGGTIGRTVVLQLSRSSQYSLFNIRPNLTFPERVSCGFGKGPGNVVDAQRVAAELPAPMHHAEDIGPYLNERNDAVGRW